MRSRKVDVKGDWLTEGFEAHRQRLRAVACRMLGSPTEADDAVQDAWLDLQRADLVRIDNLGKWLTTVVARVCLDKLRARVVRREEPIEPTGPLTVIDPASGTDPEQEALLADSVGLALLVVLDKLTPAERVAFVLHDIFDLPFDEIAPIIGRSALAARQVASRARRRVHGSTVPEAVLANQRRVVAAFLAASREGDLAALIAALDPEAVLHADPMAVRAGAIAELRGAEAIAGAFVRRPAGTRLALVNGAPGLAWGRDERPHAFSFHFKGDKISAIDLIWDPEHISAYELRSGSDHKT